VVSVHWDFIEHVSHRNLKSNKNVEVFGYIYISSFPPHQRQNAFWPIIHSANSFTCSPSREKKGDTHLSTHPAATRKSSQKKRENEWIAAPLWTRMKRKPKKQYSAVYSFSLPLKRRMKSGARKVGCKSDQSKCITNSVKAEKCFTPDWRVTHLSAKEVAAANKVAVDGYWVLKNSRRDQVMTGRQGSLSSSSLQWRQSLASSFDSAATVKTYTLSGEQRAAAPLPNCGQTFRKYRTRRLSPALSHVSAPTAQQRSAWCGRDLHFNYASSLPLGTWAASCGGFEPTVPSAKLCGTDEPHQFFLLEIARDSVLYCKSFGKNTSAQAHTLLFFFENN